MIRQDYILRLIEAFGASWAQIVRQLDAKLFPSARATVRAAYQQHLGLDAAAAQALPARDLLARVRFGEEEAAARDRSIVLAALLKADGDIAQAGQQADVAAMYHHKALDVMLTVHTKDAPAALPAFAPAIGELVAALSSYTLPAATLDTLMQFYEQRGAYAKAEDALFDLRAQAPDVARVAGAAFYTRLAALADAQLEAGNFSREEIAAGRQALRHE